MQHTRRIDTQAGGQHCKTRIVGLACCYFHACIAVKCLHVLHFYLFSPVFSSVPELSDCHESINILERI